MTLNLAIAIAFTVVGLALLIGGIIVPLLYTIIPIGRSSGCWPMNLIWRIVLKSLFLILLLKDAYVHFYVYHFGHMVPRYTYQVSDFAVIGGLLIALIATWLTHPDGMKSV